MPVRKACLQLALAAAEERTDALLTLKCLLRAGMLITVNLFLEKFRRRFRCLQISAC